MIGAAHAAPVQMIGFESGDTAECRSINGTGGYETTTVRTGSGAYRFDPADGAAVVGNCRLAGVRPDARIDGTFGGAGTGVATMYFRGYLRIAALPDNDEEVLKVLDTSAANKAALRITSGGILKLYDESLGLVATGTTALSLDTWYRINLNVPTGSGTYTLKIDGVSEFTGTHDFGASNSAEVRLGKGADTNAQGLTGYWDDVLIDDSTEPGAGQILPMDLDGDGSTMQFTVGAGGAGTGDYTDVDEYPSNDNTDFVAKSSGASQVALFDLETSASAGISGTINAVKVQTSCRESTSGTSAGGIRIDSNGTTADSGTYNHSTSFTKQAYFSGTDPDTGAAWTTSGLDALEVGVRDTSSISAYRCSTVWAFVDFTDSAATATPTATATATATATPTETPTPVPVTLRLLSSTGVGQ